ncbi:MAG: hypothetical protein QOD75_3663 [Blastocatellia bacterium]|nr:hypothetical protein [Blastocatellia bacterium]
MQEIDMSERAITARLKLVSELYRLGLSLQTTKIDPRPEANPGSDKDWKHTGPKKDGDK